MPSQTTRQFSERAYREGVPIGAAYVLCRNRGLLPQAAAQLAEEAAAEAHRRALVHDAFNDYQHFCNWLAVTAQNWVRDQFRRRRPLPLPDHDGWACATAEAEDWEEEALLRLRECLARLRPADQEVLRLTFLDRLTLDEAAAVLEPNGKGSPNARRLRIMRRRDVAIRRLRDYFGR